MTEANELDHSHSMKLCLLIFKKTLLIYMALTRELTTTVRRALQGEIEVLSRIHRKNILRLGLWDFVMIKMNKCWSISTLQMVV